MKSYEKLLLYKAIRNLQCERVYVCVCVWAETSSGLSKVSDLQTKFDI